MARGEGEQQDVRTRGHVEVRPDDNLGRAEDGLAFLRAAAGPGAEDSATKVFPGRNPSNREARSLPGAPRALLTLLRKKSTDLQLQSPRLENRGCLIQDKPLLVSPSTPAS
ncbi:Rho Gtpase-Activating Protein 39 [Manis pentadactyla]|nr:Rho Gtpase-Activating Protein 39 [Manis pentadactyla]